MNKKVTLPSGAELEICTAPFAKAKALFQAILDVARDLKLDSAGTFDVNLAKDLFCLAVSSERIEGPLSECMKHALYNGLKITADTWEPVEARGDYLQACYEVAQENVLPFTKHLYAEFAKVLRLLQSKSPA